MQSINIHNLDLEERMYNEKHMYIENKIIYIKDINRMSINIIKIAMYEIKRKKSCALDNCKIFTNIINNVNTIHLLIM